MRILCVCSRSYLRCCCFYFSSSRYVTFSWISRKHVTVRLLDDSSLWSPYSTTTDWNRKKRRNNLQPALNYAKKKCIHNQNIEHKKKKKNAKFAYSVCNSTLCSSFHILFFSLYFFISLSLLCFKICALQSLVFISNSCNCVLILSSALLRIRCVLLVHTHTYTHFILAQMIFLLCLRDSSLLLSSFSVFTLAISMRCSNQYSEFVFFCVLLMRSSCACSLVSVYKNLCVFFFSFLFLREAQEY